MLRVTIELVPHGDEERSKIMGIGMIANTGGGSITRGNYHYVLFGRGSRVYKSGNTERFLRKQQTAWRLLYECLKVAFGGKDEGHG